MCLMRWKLLVFFFSLFFFCCLNYKKTFLFVLFFGVFFLFLLSYAEQKKEINNNKKNSLRNEEKRHSDLFLGIFGVFVLFPFIKFSCCVSWRSVCSRNQFVHIPGRIKLFIGEIKS